MTAGRNWFVWRVVAAATLMGLLVAGGFAIHRLGWSQGYAAAELAAEEEDITTPPLAPRSWRPIGITGERLLISVLLGLAFFAVVGKLLRFIMWGAIAGPAMWHPAMAQSCKHPRHWMHGSVPPWHSRCYEQAVQRPQARDDPTHAEP